MNIWIFIIAIFVVVAILISLNFDNMYNYFTYVVPIKHVKLIDEPFQHIDPAKIIDPHSMPIPLKKFEHIKDDNSLTAIFGGGVSSSDYFKSIPDFSYVENFQINQTFAFRCIENEDFTFLGFYKYLGTTIMHDDEYLLLWHFEGETQNPMPCNYPDVIINSIDVLDVEPRENYLTELHGQFGL